jgi:hypothetical protein
VLTSDLSHLPASDCESANEAERSNDFIQNNARSQPKSNIKFLNYNVNGLLPKLDNKDFMEYITNYDFICLTETFISFDLDAALFNDYMCYTSKAKKFTHHGRYSGGVIALIHKKFSKYVSLVSNSSENALVVKIDKGLLKTDKDVMWVCCYIPPEQSPFWKSYQEGYGMELLDKCVIDLFDTHHDFHLLLSGDFNARTADSNFIPSDHTDPLDSDMYEKSKYCRTTVDNHVNCFGDQLIEFCSIFDCVILNGLQEQQFDNSFTFISTGGCSIVDYFIMSCELFSLLNVKTLKVNDVTESDHLPISLLVELESESIMSESCKEHIETFTGKYVWNKEKEGNFIEKFKSEDCQNLLKNATALLENDVNGALNVFVKCMKDASSCMYRNVKEKKVNIKSRWFDEECREAKKESRQKLKIFRKTRLDEDRIVYVQARKKYRLLIKHKKKIFKKVKADTLVSSMSDSSLFWAEVNKMGCGKSKNSTDASISTDEWLKHFKDVFQADVDCHEDNVNSDVSGDQNDDHILNMSISEEEVQSAVNKLNNGKAAGTDEITAEMLKTGGSEVVCFLTKLFNVLFSKGMYPDEWSKAIIVPIFKKGDNKVPDNYRGVSLLSIVSKCYTSVLNTRLYLWLEDNNKISECQAGFRKSYSTIDQIFNLYAVVQKTLNTKGRKLYCAFIDFKKAFDSVRHSKLLECLCKQGVKGKFLKALEAMYESLVSCVKANHKVSDFFDCPKGVRQGCVMSPTLFSIFINQLADHMNERGKHGIQVLPGLIELFILLFADDVVLLSSTPAGLQNQLNVLNECCNNMKLEINIQKSKVMVFRKGGFLSTKEKWHLNGMKLEVVNKYCYLGFCFTTKLSSKLGTDHLVTKGKKSLYKVCKAFQKLKEMSQAVFFKIFDAKIQPVLLYSSEIWGLKRLKTIETVHLHAAKRFLGVPTKSPNKMVYGDLKRHPLYINSFCNSVRYWLRLLKMEKSRLTHNAYHMLLALDNLGKDCWVSNIRNILCESGFGFVWLQQGVGNDKMFLRLFKERLIDMFIQEWSGTIRDSDRYYSYRSFKTLFEKEKYLLCEDDYCFRVALSQTRFGTLPLNNNIFRYSDRVEDKFCFFCKTKIENEIHLIYECKIYDDLRCKFLKDSVKKSSHILLRLDNDSDIHNLSRFVFHAMRRRNKVNI